MLKVLENGVGGEGAEELDGLGPDALAPEGARRMLAAALTALPRPFHTRPVDYADHTVLKQGGGSPIDRSTDRPKRTCGDAIGAA